MARKALRLPGNANGNLFVDSTCIDCGTCRYILPEVFGFGNGTAVVDKQPAGEQEERRALKALFSCPSNSIGVETKPDFYREERLSFPWPVEKPVYHLGFHSESSFGAAAYVLVHPEGNVMIDSPRFNPDTKRAVEELGGIKKIFLTHKDDIADHRKFASHFGAERYMHADDYSSRYDKGDGLDLGPMEHIWQGETISLGTGLEAIWVPGHTKGSTVLLADDTFLFTGDSLAFHRREDRLHAFRNATWYDWDTLRESMTKLAGYNFRWIIPGHGLHYKAKDAAEMKERMQKLLLWMEEVA